MPRLHDRAHVRDRASVHRIRQFHARRQVEEAGHQCRARILEDNEIWGAGLDIFENEPKVEELNELDNVVAMTHIASTKRRARLDMGGIAAGNCIKALDG